MGWSFFGGAFLTRVNFLDPLPSRGLQLIQSTTALSRRPVATAVRCFMIHEQTLQAKKWFATATPDGDLLVLKVVFICTTRPYGGDCLYFSSSPKQIQEELTKKLKPQKENATMLLSFTSPTPKKKDNKKHASQAFFSPKAKELLKPSRSQSLVELLDRLLEAAHSAGGTARWSESNEVEPSARASALSAP